MPQSWNFNSCEFNVACLVLVGRVASVFPLSFLSNLTKRCKSDKIEFKQQFTRSGHTPLDGNAFMIASIITIVLFSTVVLD